MPRFAPWRFALRRFAPWRFALRRFASLRYALLRSASLRSALLGGQRGTGQIREKVKEDENGIGRC